MKSYEEVIIKKANDKFNNYMSGSMFYDVDIDDISYIYEIDENKVYIDIDVAFKEIKNNFNKNK
jgi:hypothetical protein